MHYAIVIVIIVCIIYFQGCSFYDTKKKIKRYKGIFPKSNSDYALEKILIKSDSVTSNEDDDLPIEDVLDDEDINVQVSQIKIIAVR